MTSPSRRRRTPARRARGRVASRPLCDRGGRHRSAWSKSAIRSSTSSRPTEQRSSPAAMPASASCAASSWRWVVDGGWATIVWMLPSEAVRSGIVRASMNASPAGRAAVHRRARTRASRRRPGTGAGRPRAGDGWAGPGSRPARRPAGPRASPPARCRRGVPVHPDRERGEAAQDEEGREGGEGRARVDLEGRRPAMSSRGPTTMPPRASEWPPMYFVADSATRSAPSSSGRQRSATRTCCRR